MWPHWSGTGPQAAELPPPVLVARSRTFKPPPTRNSGPSNHEMIKVVSGFEPTFTPMLLPKQPARKRLHLPAPPGRRRNLGRTAPLPIGRGARVSTFGSTGAPQRGRAATKERSQHGGHKVFKEATELALGRFLCGLRYLLCGLRVEPFLLEPRRKQELALQWKNGPLRGERVRGEAGVRGCLLRARSANSLTHRFAVFPSPARGRGPL